MEPNLQTAIIAGATAAGSEVVKALRAAGAALFEPVGTVANSHADAHALRVRTNAEIETAGLKARAERLEESRNIRHQRNLEMIVEKAQKALPPPM